MSESTIPFQGGGTAVMDRPAPEFEPESGGGGSRTKLLALGGLAAVVVLGLVAYFLLFSGGEAVEEGPVVKPRAAAPAPAAPAEEPATVKTPRLSSKNFGRDPFKVLITEPVAAVEPVTTTATTATTGTTSGTTSTTTPETTTPVASTSHTFKVVEVAPDNSTITVKVDGEFYRNLRAGEVFATYFKVVLISGQVNSFQYGEEKFNVLGTKKLTIA